MIVCNEDNLVEYLCIKDSAFALVFKNEPLDKNFVASFVSSLPPCTFEKTKLAKIQKLYLDISNNCSVSLEDIYSVYGINSDLNTTLFCPHKRQTLKEYRVLISDIIDQSIKQIKKNLDKVNIPNLTHTIFYKAQEFTDQKPKFISNLWFLGNAAHTNQCMKDAFESYTMAPQSLRNDPRFCVERLEQFLRAIQESIKDSFRMHFLDSVLDQIYHWYFIESESKYDFLIFLPDVFDPIKDFLLRVINENPFVYLLRDNGRYYEKLKPGEECLLADAMLFVPEELFESITCYRELYRMYDEFYAAHKAIKQYGKYTCYVYDITDLTSIPMSKNVNKLKILKEHILYKLHPNNPILFIENVIQDKEEFIKQTVKQKLNKTYLANKKAV